MCRGVNRRAVSELALGLIFSLLRRVVPLCAEVRQGQWRQSQGGELSGRTVGIIGGGHIGKDLIFLLAPFRCRILCHDPAVDKTFMAEHGVKMAGLEELLRESDVVSLHVPLNDLTRGMLNRERLASMKKGALLVNVSRGGVVDEAAVRDLLANEHLGGAAFDVFAEEPPRDAGLLALPNFIATPHIAGTTVESVLEMGRAAIAGLRDEG
jgi:phosphoglycerate dehydrogenase-like enzyme